MIFILNKYTKWYYQIIDKAKTEARSKKESYFENHHIIPKCFNGANKKENLVLLTAREHFICHWLLCKMFNDNRKCKMYNAFWQMTQKSDNQKRKISSKQYEICKKYIAKANSIQSKGNKSRTGQPISLKQRQEHSIKMTGTGNPMFGKKRPDSIFYTKNPSKGKHWYTNKIKQGLFFEENYPEGWIRGKIY